MYQKLALFVTVYSLSLFSAVAQEPSCSPERDAVIETVSEGCDGIGRNQVCYGNERIISEVSAGEFDQQGDMIPVADLLSLQTIDGAPDNDDWGLAVFNLRVNLPDTLPGQLVMMIVFGDATIEPNLKASMEDYPEPMQAFYLSTGVGIPECNELPDRGLLIQNSSGEAVTLLINEYDVTINSTALFLAEDKQQLTVTTYEGVVAVTSDDEIITIPEGFTVTVGGDDNEGEEVTLAPDLPPTLPIALLPESVPLIGEPTTTAVGLLQCANEGGIDVTEGSTVVLRAGWAENETADLLSFVASDTPTLIYDGVSLRHHYRSGPADWERDGETGFRMDWFWEITNVTAGTHTADWNVAGQTVSCEIRAQ